MNAPFSLVVVSGIKLKAAERFQRVAHLIPADAPVILESKVEESEIEEEITNALSALNTKDMLAAVGD